MSTLGQRKYDLSRLDLPAEIVIGPESKRVRFADVGSDPYIQTTPSVPDGERELSKASSEALARRCSVWGMQHEVRQMMQNPQLGVSVRKRLVTWVEDGTPGQGETAHEKAERLKGKQGGDNKVNGDSDGEALRALEDGVPDAFKFQANSELANAYFVRYGRQDESAIKGPKPSGSLTASHDTSPPPPKTDIDNSDAQQPLFLLSISVFARQTRRMWARERYAKLLKPFTAGIRPVDADSDGTGNGSDSREEEDREEYEQGSLATEESSEGHGSSQDEEAGKSKKIGREGPYAQLQLVQKFELRSDATLQRLREGFVCRMDDLPEAAESEAGFKQWRKLKRKGDLHSAVPIMRRYTGRKRNTDSCFLIEGKLYSHVDGPERYAMLLSSHFARQYSGKSVGPAQASEQLMSDVSLNKLALHAGKLYWFLHQGSCEHLWAITSVRLLRPSETLNGPYKTLDAMTTYLQYGFMIRPLVRWSRAKARSESYSLDKCQLCRVRAACMVVLGGERFRAPDNAVHLPGLKEGTMCVCEACWCGMVGREPPGIAELIQRAGKGVPSDMSGMPWAGAGGEGWTVIPGLD